jgi:hypothetical protein
MASAGTLPRLGSIVKRRFNEVIFCSFYAQWLERPDLTEICSFVYSLPFCELLPRHDLWKDSSRRVNIRFFSYQRLL